MGPQVVLFGRAVGTLDMFPVRKRIWGVAYRFHATESQAASQFARHHLRMILDGQVGYVLSNLRRRLEAKKNSARKRERP